MLVFCQLREELCDFPLCVEHPQVFLSHTLRAVVPTSLKLWASGALLSPAPPHAALVLGLGCGRGCDVWKGSHGVPLPPVIKAAEIPCTYHE